MTNPTFGEAPGSRPAGQHPARVSSPTHAAHQLIAMLCRGLGVRDGSVLACHVVERESLPATFRDLLDHDEHMTVRLQTYHSRPVALRVLSHAREDQHYRRMILLTGEGTDQVVEFGVVRVNLQCTNDEVRKAIESRDTPLGYILHRHGVLTRVEPRWFLCFPAGSELHEYFGDAVKGDLYGRLATIYFDNRPALELLEVVTDQRIPASG